MVIVLLKLSRTSVVGIVRTLVIGLLLLGPGVWFFAEILRPDRTLGYRDGWMFYRPLFQWLDSEWAAGRVPLWNPQQCLGAPTFADPTSSVFYPGKLLFVFPFDFATRYELYVLVHLLVCAGSAYAVVRRWNGSVTAGLLAALSYAYGGAVLFQAHNVVFLVGAAWMPWALWFADRLLSGGGWRAAAGLAAVLALMTLGGDPQATYHAGLAAAALLVIRWLQRRRERSGSETLAIRQVGREFGWLSLAAVGAFALAAIQILPTLSWTRASTRAVYFDPRTIWETADLLSRTTANRDVVANSIARGLVGVPEPGIHDNEIYRFSLYPLRLCELIWPNFGGRDIPRHHHWLLKEPQLGAPWTPTIYMGLLPITLALAAARLRRGDCRAQWLTWSTLLAIVASFGEFGLVAGVRWLWPSLANLAWNEVPLGDHVGSLYWLMVVLLPSYVQFRYPAKLVTFAALGLSLLAARGWDELQQDQGRRLRRILQGVVVASVLGVLALELNWSAWWTYLHRTQPLSWLGKLDAGGASRDVLLAMIHATVLSLGCLWLLRRCQGDQRRWLAPAMLIITTGELLAANSWLMPSIPEALLAQPPKIVSELKAAGAGRSDLPPPRVMHLLHRSVAQRITESPARDFLEYRIAGSYEQLLSPWHLVSNLAVVNANGTTMHASTEFLASLAKANGPNPQDADPRMHEQYLRALSIDYELRAQVPTETAVARAVAAPPSYEVLTVERVKDPLPRVWVVREIEHFPEMRDRRLRWHARRCTEILLHDGQVRDFRRSAVVESADRPEWLGAGMQSDSPAKSRDSDVCRITKYEPNQVEIAARLSAPGLLVLNDLYADGWEAMVRTAGAAVAHEQPIWCTNRVMRGVWLPAGEHHVVFQYRPASLFAGSAISATAWLCMLVGLVLSRSNVLIRRLFHP